jgi:hypothetical protein
LKGSKKNRKREKLLGFGREWLCDA